MVVTITMYTSINPRTGRGGVSDNLWREMATFAYLCPNNGQRTQVRLRRSHSSQSHEGATATICPACQHRHFVNPLTGEVLSANHSYAKLHSRDAAGAA
jgi:hypothetical protein